MSSAVKRLFDSKTKSFFDSDITSLGVLFDSRIESFFDSDMSSLGVLPSIVEALHKYELFDYFEN